MKDYKSVVYGRSFLIRKKTYENLPAKFIGRAVRVKAYGIIFVLEKSCLTTFKKGSKRKWKNLYYHFEEMTINTNTLTEIYSNFIDIAKQVMNEKIQELEL